MTTKCISVITKLEKNNSAKFKHENHPGLYDFVDA